jgi:hypothetical protein
MSPGTTISPRKPDLDRQENGGANVKRAVMAGTNVSVAVWFCCATVELRRRLTGNTQVQSGWGTVASCAAITVKHVQL